jgi:hypothetical protein
VAIAWSDLEEAEVREALRLLEQVIAMTWRRTHWGAAAMGA